MREAQVVKQTRENDMDLEPRHHSVVSQSSPSLLPAQDLEGIPEDDIMDISSGLSSSFKQHAMKNSKGKDFWETFTDESGATPPPAPTLPRGSSSGISDELHNSSAMSTPPSSFIHSNSQPTASDAQGRPMTPHTGPTQAEIQRKVNNKRRRDDDFDIASFKRRAVSPGMSAHNSPIVQSPMQRDHTAWGSRPPSNGESGKGANGGVKRVGLQGMVDTSDGLMKMSIE